MTVTCAYVHIHRNVGKSAATDGTMNARRINYLLHHVLQILAQAVAAKLHRGISRLVAILHPLFKPHCAS